MKKNWSWQPWMRWFVPLPILIWISKRNFQSHVWYQDDKVQLELYGRFKDGCSDSIRNTFGNVKSYNKRIKEEKKDE